MSKYILCPLIVMFLYFLPTATAQKYNYAMGVRMGTEIGASLTPRIAKKVTLEGLLQYSKRYHTSRASILWRQHQGFLGKRFNIYLGAGPGWAWYHKADPDLSDEQSLNAVAIFGVEGTLGRLNISWDFKPVYSVSGPRTFYSETAVSLRYVIFRKKWQPFKKKKLFWKRIF